ncbi:Hypothetical predicted protein [Olea europaea subsp. europaea]|uniref:Uncharacterized protein n=1 Tax=Olea europaea subsp. europaea TaxID=158383 RepID=A0A8S0THD2_OLEEU|nr:Hypothetical predicted protein [Olea europaea subsp. europaea]
MRQNHQYEWTQMQENNSKVRMDRNHIRRNLKQDKKNWLHLLTLKRAARTSHHLGVMELGRIYNPPPGAGFEYCTDMAPSKLNRPIAMSIGQLSANGTCGTPLEW